MLESAGDFMAYMESFGVPIICDQGTFTAIFDNEYLAAVGMDDAAPAIVLPTADAVRLGITPKGTPLTIAGEVYRTVAVQPDGVGITRIVLQR